MFEKLFALIYKKWIYYENCGRYAKIIKVKGWRTALIETPYGERMTVSPCFWWFK